jgi:hypothetical protein
MLAVDPASLRDRYPGKHKFLCERCVSSEAPQSGIQARAVNQLLTMMNFTMKIRGIE